MIYKFLSTVDSFVLPNSKVVKAYAYFAGLKSYHLKFGKSESGVSLPAQIANHGKCLINEQKLGCIK